MFPPLFPRSYSYGPRLFKGRQYTSLIYYYDALFYLTHCPFLEEVTLLVYSFDLKESIQASDVTLHHALVVDTDLSVIHTEWKGEIFRQKKEKVHHFTIICPHSLGVILWTTVYFSKRWHFHVSTTHWNRPHSVFPRILPNQNKNKKRMCYLTKEFWREFLKLHCVEW